MLGHYTCQQSMCLRCRRTVTAQLSNNVQCSLYSSLFLLKMFILAFSLSQYTFVIMFIKYLLLIGLFGEKICNFCPLNVDIVCYWIVFCVLLIWSLAHCIAISQHLMQTCVGHTGWAPEGCKGQVQAGLEDSQLEIRANGPQDFLSFNIFQFWQNR